MDINLYDLEKLENTMRARRKTDFSIVLYYHLTQDLENLYIKLGWNDLLNKKSIF